MAHFIALLLGTVCYNLGHFYFMAYIYKHIRKDTNEVFYIGIAKSKKRKNSKFNRNSFWKNITIKTEYISEIIEDNLSWETACEREKYWIKYYGRRDLNEGTLVNMTDGGEGCVGMIRTDLHNKKISKSKKGLKFTETHRENLKKARKKIMTAEMRKQIGERAKNISDETRLKMSESARNRIRDKIPCEYCGQIISSDHKTQHQSGKKCKNLKNNINERI